VPEGHDKPYKYPGIFTGVDAVVLNKADMIDVFEFDLDNFRRGVEMLVKPGVPLFVVSCRTGEGMDGWAAWLAEHVAARQQQRPT
jgi:hydrogenase nickel incorporation protein HypB